MTFSLYRLSSTDCQCYFGVVNSSPILVLLTLPLAVALGISHALYVPHAASWSLNEALSQSVCFIKCGSKSIPKPLRWPCLVPASFSAENFCDAPCLCCAHRGIS